MNVYDQAHNLAQAIKESEEFKQFDASRKEIKENPQLDEAVKDLMNRQFEIQAAQMMGNEPDAESMEKLQQLSAIMMQDPLAARYLQCQMRFSMMMADVYKIIGETEDMGIGPAAGGENE